MPDLAADLATLAAANERQEALAAIASCRLCDPAGWRDGVKCNHPPPPPPPREDPTVTETETDQRCRCRHRAAKHETVCRACGCKRFEPRPPAWRVRRDPVGLAAITLAGPWRVESPRGVEVYRAPCHRTAFELACSLAAVDDLLARVSRLERRPELTVLAGGAR